MKPGDKHGKKKVLQGDEADAKSINRNCTFTLALSAAFYGHMTADFLVSVEGTPPTTHPKCVIWASHNPDFRKIHPLALESHPGVKSDPGPESSSRLRSQSKVKSILVSYLSHSILIQIVQK